MCPLGQCIFNKHFWRHLCSRPLTEQFNLARDNKLRVSLHLILFVKTFYLLCWQPKKILIVKNHQNCDI